MALLERLEFANKICWSSFIQSSIEGLSLLSIRTQRDARSANMAMDSILYELRLISGSITFRSLFLLVTICLTCNTPETPVIRIFGTWKTNFLCHYFTIPVQVYNSIWWKEYSIPVVQDFCHWVLGSDPQLSVQSKAQAKPLQMHKHHFVKWACLSVIVSTKINFCAGPESEKNQKAA